MTECLFFGLKKKNLLNWDPRSVPSIHIRLKFQLQAEPMLLVSADTCTQEHLTGPRSRETASNLQWASRHPPLTRTCSGLTGMCHAWLPMWVLDVCIQFSCLHSKHSFPPSHLPCPGLIWFFSLARSSVEVREQLAGVTPSYLTQSGAQTQVIRLGPKYFTCWTVLRVLRVLLCIWAWLWTWDSSLALAPPPQGWDYRYTPPNTAKDNF